MTPRRACVHVPDGAGTALVLSAVHRGAGPAFVFQHGLGADAAQPLALCPEALDFEVAVLECRGHGHSSLGALEPSLALFTEDLARFLATLDERRPVLGGLSMGAAIALRHACRTPAKLRALVLVRPAWTLEAAPANMQVFGEIAELLDRYGPDQAVTRFRASERYRTIESESPDNAASLLRQFERRPVDSTIRLLRSLSRDEPGIDARCLQELELPTLVVGTLDDAVHPFAMAEALADRIPRARLVTVVSKSRDADAHQRECQDAIGQFLSEL